MMKTPLFYDDGSPPPGPYDAAPQDPWFLRDDTASDLPPPLHPGDWHAAQGRLSADLARLALLYGTLTERLRAGPQGWRHRLALMTAARISGASGDRVSPDRLALWEARHLSGAQDDAQGLTRAAWAFRRLMGTTPPQQDLAGFLARQGAAEDVADLSAQLAGLADLHPATRAAAVTQAWQIPDQPARCIEAAVLGSRLAAEMAGPGFVPVMGCGGGGSPQAVLALWLAGAQRETQGALLHLDRLRAWQDQAQATLTGWQGRIPLPLIHILTAWPLVSAAMAETLTGANRSTVQRNLTALQATGLLREVTGQGRYRLWTARL
ncbi:MAG: hypothetical protein H7317_07845 [Pseudorhodobacter sp.]|nr:hypothetical protein [Pseudorhodobacter sp.]